MTKKYLEASRHLCDYTVNPFHKSAPKYSLPACSRYTVLGSGVKSPIFIDSSSRSLKAVLHAAALPYFS